MTKRGFTRQDIERAIKGFYGLPEDARVSFLTYYDRVEGCHATFEGEVGNDPNKIMREDIVSIRALMEEESRRRKEEHNRLLGEISAKIREAKTQQAVDLDIDYEEIETRMAAAMQGLFDVYRTHIRRDTRGECKKLRVKVREDAEELDDNMREVMSAGFSTVQKDLAQGVMLGCQKALDAQTKLFHDAVAKANKTPVEPEDVAARSYPPLKTGDSVMIVNSDTWSGRRGSVVETPATTGYSQYRVGLNGGGAVWMKRHQMKRLAEFEVGERVGLVGYTGDERTGVVVAVDQVQIKGEDWATFYVVDLGTRRVKFDEAQLMKLPIA